MAISLFFPSLGTAGTDLLRGGAHLLLVVFNPRDRFSAWSHGAAALAALPATRLLWHRSRGDRLRRINLLVYGLSMLACYTASALFHAATGPARRIAAFNRFDHIGIYLFIAGSYTGIGTNLLRGRLCWMTTLLAWVWAAAGSAVQLAGAPLPPTVATGLYLGMGWALALVYLADVKS